MYAAKNFKDNVLDSSNRKAPTGYSDNRLK